MSKLPYPENRGSTHWEGCWRVPKHHNCAVREVERLQRTNQKSEKLKRTLFQLLGCGSNGRIIEEIKKLQSAIAKLAAKGK